MRLQLTLVLMLVCSLLGASVKINELCYNPQGADFGKEWIELYNPTAHDIDLTDWLIVSGGTSYSADFLFPYYVLRAGRFVVVGGDEVPQAHFRHNFRFQNGGGASDGVRLISRDGNYTDTVIYDAPNINELIDDSGGIAFSFAENAPEGSSLARIMDGYDSNLCAQDFIAEPSPTPGMPNRVYADYALSEAEITPTDAGICLSLRISNNSMLAPSQNATLSVFAEEELLIFEEIAPIPPRGYIVKEYHLEQDWRILWLYIDLPEDVNPANNSLYFCAEGEHDGSPIINEIMPMPLPRRQEWVELYAPALQRGSAVYVLKDAAQNSISFELPPAVGYYVICKDKATLLTDYPFCPPGSVIEVPRLPSLNDDGDELYLYNADESRLIDSMAYTRDMIARDMSLLRFEDESGVRWKKGKANPGKPNDFVESTDPNLDPDQEERLRVIGSPAFAGERIGISYAFEDESGVNISCTVYSLSGHKIRTLARGEAHPPRGIIYWDGYDTQGKRAARGLYIILWESKAGKGRLYRKQLSGVIG